MFVPKSVIFLRRYSWPQFRADLGAGVVVGLVALPLAMAFAIASGLPPERGLYTAVVAGFLISALGGSRVQIGGPTGAFVVIVSGIVARHGYDGLALATLMAGVILILMGLARLGTVIRFIPYPVTAGFTAGIAVVIFSTQVKDLLGLGIATPPAEFLDKWRAYAAALPSFDATTAALGCGTVALIGIWPKAWRRVPAPIVALAGMTALAWHFALPVDTIGSRFGGVPAGLPAPALPVWSWEQVRSLVPAATTIAILAAIESLLSAVVADGMIGGRHKSNLELVAQGVANLASPLFGGIPATGAVARTATNVKNGGRTPMAGMIHAAVLLLVLMTAGPLAARIPMACLAGILVVVSYHMSEWRACRAILSAPRSDVLVLVTTFGLTVLVDLTVAVEVGMVLAAFLFMKNMAETTQVRSLTRAAVRQGVNPDATRRIQAPADVEVFEIQGTFFFGAAQKLLESIRLLGRRPRALVLDMGAVLHLDATGINVLDQIFRDCRARGTRLLFAGIHAQPLAALVGSQRYREYGVDNFTPDLAAALGALRGRPVRVRSGRRRPR